jgi:transcriptional regulator with XRE-family HTH domain
MAEKEINDKRILKIADRIKKLRIAKGYSSYETFAFDHELSRRSYWRLENGTNFTIEKLLNILDIHKISIEDFFSKDFDKKVKTK